MGTGDLNAIVARVERDHPGFAASEAERFGAFLAWEADGLVGLASPDYVASQRTRARGMLRKAAALRVGTYSSAKAHTVRLGRRGPRASRGRRVVRVAAHGPPGRQHRPASGDDDPPHRDDVAHRRAVSA